MIPDDQQKQDDLFRRLVADMRRKPTWWERLKPFVLPAVIVVVLLAWLWWLLRWMRPVDVPDVRF